VDSMGRGVPAPSGRTIKFDGEAGAPSIPYRVRRPNVLFIMSDQHRYDWMGCAGLSQVSTPAIDGLAAEGVRFTQATCCSPLCAPSRAALATGLRPARCHVLDNSYSLPLEHWTVYQHFRRYGYRTALFGKLDLHKPQFYNGVYGDLPVLYHLGFTDPLEAEGKQHAGQIIMVERPDGTRERLLLGPYQRYLESKGLLDRFCADYEFRKTQHSHYAEPSVLPAEDFEDAYIGRQACAFLREVNDDSPWFAFVSFVGPHLPFDAPREYLERYLDVDMPAPAMDTGTPRSSFVERKQEAIGRGTDETTALKMRKNYSGAVTLIDDAIGEMLRVLDERGMREDTIIVYTSDHGEMLGDLGLVGKSVQYESALRVPLILSGYGVERSGTFDALVELFDVTPTLLDMVGLPVPAGLDARSFLPVLRGAVCDHRDVQIAQLPFTMSVRDARYKAIINPNDRPELYDLIDDPDEMRNIHNAHSEVYRRLVAKYHMAVTGGMELNG